MTPLLPIAAAGSAALAGFAYATVAPTCQFWGDVISHGRRDRGQIALTFDDGPTPETTDRILDELHALNVRATFFIIGVNAEKHPDLLRRIHDEGHLIANHSFHHSHYGVMRRRRYWEREIRDTDELIRAIIGERPRFFRPPMGVKTWHTTAAAREFGHALLTWSRRAMDGIPTTPERILHRFRHVRAGDILLLHDGIEPYSPHHDRTATINVIRPLVESLRSRGLTPVRADELLLPELTS